MFEVVQVRLREAGKISYYKAEDLQVKAGEYCIVEVDKGLEYGQVISDPEMMLSAEALEEPVGRFIRIATARDTEQIEENKKKAKEIYDACQKKIEERELPMKLIEAEYTFDRSKVILYFTSEGRVDFRDLVRELARSFKARIELKQIGVRDEAKLLGGYGCCGRRLCCATFLKDFDPVSVKMAKEQCLPLNPSKISGTCGRLMCCLGYEYTTYRELLKGLPREGETVNTKEGPGKVVSLNPLKRTVMVELEEGRQIEVSYPAG